MNRKDKIRKTAFRLFAEKGFSDVSINDIIHGADVTKGCFYHYFTSKNQLIGEVCQYYICSYFRNIFARIRTEECAPRERLVHLCVGLLSFEEYIENKLKEEAVPFEQFYYLLIEGTKKYDFIRKYRQDFFAEAIEIAAAILEEGKRQRVVRENINSGSVALRILTDNEGLATLNLLYGRSEIKKHAVNRLNDLWNAIAA